MVGTLAAHEAGGHPAQLVIDPRDEFTPGPVVALSGPPQNERQVPPRLGLHHPSVQKTRMAKLGGIRPRPPRADGEAVRGRDRAVPQDIPTPAGGLFPARLAAVEKRCRVTPTFSAGLIGEARSGRPAKLWESDFDAP